nr:porin [Roseateles koreensis]
MAATLLMAGAPAMAQVTISGYVDAALEHISSGGKTLNRLSSGGLTTSRLEFTAKEDLGNGLSAKIRHEMILNADTGVMGTNSRETYVQLAHKDWGDINLGRLNLSSYNLYGYADPTYGSSYSPVNNMMVFYAPWRESNAVSFNSANFSGFQFRATVTAGQEDSLNTKNGRVVSVGASYMNGPLYLSLATDTQDKTNIFDKTKTKNESSHDTYLSAVYRIGDVELTGILHDYRGYYAYAPYVAFDTHGTSVQLGTRIKLNQSWRLFASVVRRDDATGALADSTGVALGTTYNFSPRTTVYATYGTVRNGATGSAGAQYPIDWGLSPKAGENPEGYMFGLRHAF